MTGQRVSPPHMPRRRGRAFLIAAFTSMLLFSLAGPAYSYWTATSSGPYGLAKAATLTPPVLTAGTATTTTVPLSWTQPFTPTAYTLAQSPGTLAGCNTAPGTGSSGCTATGLIPNTSYTWTLTAFRNNWVQTATATTTTPKQATSTALTNLTPSTGGSGTIFNATATVTGSSSYGTPAGTVTFSMFTSATCTGTATYNTAALTLNAGTIAGSLQPVAGTYYWRATYTPTDAYNLTSTSSCSSAITVTPGGTFTAIGTPVTKTGTSTSVAVPYPAGTTTGDLVILVVVNNGSQTSTVPAGWTVIASPGSTVKLQAWWHKSGAETSVTLPSFGASASGGATAWVLDYKNMANPATAGISSNTASSGSSLTPNNLTTTNANTTVISLVAINAARSLTLPTPRSFTLRTAVQDTTLTGRALGVADGFVATAGTVPSPTWSAGASSSWAYITVAFTS